jgi:glycine oxidase
MRHLQPGDTVHLVGQGLAGSVLAFRLIECGWKPTVFDPGHEASSSLVAAGMWNPVNFKRLHVGQDPRSYLETLHALYQRMEKWLGVTFYQKYPVVRVYESLEESHNWDLQEALGKQSAAYLSQPHFEDLDPSVHAPHGAGLIYEGGRLDMPTLLAATRKKLKDLGLLREEIHAADFATNCVIHCSGLSVMENPLWSWLPMAPNKGQVLTLDMPLFDRRHIYHFGRFVVPLHGTTYKVGSTYELHPKDKEPDAAKGQEIYADVSRTIATPMEVVEHRAGYRPTTFDRMPLVGAHPEEVNHYIFNGFGSRGVFYVPLCAQQLVAHLTEGSPLPAAISTARVRKHFEKSRMNK